MCTFSGGKVTFGVWTLPAGFIKFQNEFFKILSFLKVLGLSILGKSQNIFLANFYKLENKSKINSSK